MKKLIIFYKKEINGFFEIDKFIIENKNEYLNENICIVQYPNGEELFFVQGSIKSFNNIKNKHLVSIEESSLYSPILL